MTTRATALRREQRSLAGIVTYGEPEVEAIAERLGVILSDEETESILGQIDGELDSLAARATQEAVASRIAAEVERASSAHASDVDD